MSGTLVEDLPVDYARNDNTGLGREASSLRSEIMAALLGSGPLEMKGIGGGAGVSVTRRPRSASL